VFANVIAVLPRVFTLSVMEHVQSCCKLAPLTVGHPVCIGDPASIRDPAFIRRNTVLIELIFGVRIAIDDSYFVLDEVKILPRKGVPPGGKLDFKRFSVPLFFGPFMPQYSVGHPNSY